MQRIAQLLLRNWLQSAASHYRRRVLLCSISFDTADVALRSSAYVTVERIGDLVDFDIHALLPPKVPSHASLEK